MSGDRRRGDPRLTDPATLLASQYGDEANLRARASLHERFGTGEPWQRWVFDRFPRDAEQRILELGCGPGRLWTENAERVPAAWHLTLTDLSPGMLASARAALGTAGLRARFEPLEATELGRDERFPPGTLDLVVANHMLYHVPDLDAVLAAVRRVLRPGGRLLAATNGCEHLAELYDLVEEIVPPGVVARPTRLAFDLENGGAALARRFDTVRVHPRYDVLRIDDPEAVVAYAASMVGVAGAPHGELPDELATALSRVRELVRDRIEREGAFVVRRVTGVFEAF